VILENFLGTSPPPPLPNVPDLKATGEAGLVLSMRERMAQHRANPVCAGCHAIMEPIGLSLENFDASASGARSANRQSRSTPRERCLMARSSSVRSGSGTRCSRSRIKSSRPSPRS